MNLPHKKGERQVLGHAIAQRTANFVPNELICREFELEQHQLDLVRKWPIYVKALTSLQATSDELALADMYLDNQEIQQEARNAFNTMITIRDNNADSDDASEQRVALDICKWILEVAGHSKVNKSLNVDAKMMIPDEYAKQILEQLQGDPSVVSTIAPVTVEVMEKLPDDIPIDSAITHKGMEAMYDATYRSGHDREDPSAPDPKTGGGADVPEAS